MSIAQTTGHGHEFEIRGVNGAPDERDEYRGCRLQGTRAGMRKSVWKEKGGVEFLALIFEVEIELTLMDLGDFDYSAALAQIRFLAIRHLRSNSNHVPSRVE